MQELGTVDLVVSACAITVAFAVRGATGFGASTIAIPVMAFALPVTLAVPLVSVLFALQALPLAVRNRNLIAWREVLHTVPSSLLGVALGLLVFANSAEALLVRGLGVVITLYALFGLCNSAAVLRVSARWRGPVAILTGLAGGSVGALYGAGAAPIYGMYLQSVALEKAVFRVTVSTMLLVPILARVLGYGGLGLYEAQVLQGLALLLPFMLIGTWLGDALMGNLDKSRFGTLVNTVLLLSGIGLLFK